MTAAALSGEKVLTYEVNLPEGKNKILYVDTEQSKAHCKRHLPGSLLLPTFPMVRTMTVWNFSPYGNTRLKNALKS